MKVKILNVRIPRDIVEWLDSLVKRGIYNSRAEAIRDFCREYINETEDVSNE